MGGDTKHTISGVCYALILKMEEAGHIKKVGDYTYEPTEEGRMFFNTVYPGSHQATFAEDLAGCFVGEPHKKIEDEQE